MSRVVPRYPTATLLLAGYKGESLRSVTIASPSEDLPYPFTGDTVMISDGALPFTAKPGLDDGPIAFAVGPAMLQVKALRLHSLEHLQAPGLSVLAAISQQCFIADLAATDTTLTDSGIFWRQRVPVLAEKVVPSGQFQSDMLAGRQLNEKRGVHTKAMRGAFRGAGVMDMITVRDWPDEQAIGDAVDIIAHLLAVRIPNGKMTVTVTVGLALPQPAVALLLNVSPEDGYSPVGQLIALHRSHSMAKGLGDYRRVPHLDAQSAHHVVERLVLDAETFCCTLDVAFALNGPDDDIPCRQSIHRFKLGDYIHSAYTHR